MSDANPPGISQPPGALSSPWPDSRFVTTAARAIVIAGAALRIVQWMRGWSLWMDESAVAVQMSLHTRHGLIGPLALEQAIPPGFLLLTNLIAGAFGRHERALRLLPLVAGIVALPLLWHVARRLLSPGGALLALALLAFAPPVVRYAAELKPYESDIAVTLAIVLIAIRIAMEGPTRPGLVALSIAGTIAVFLSFPAVFVLFGVGAGLVWEAVRHRRWRDVRGIVYASLPWLPAFALVYICFIQPVRFNPRLVDYWRGAFLPFPPRSLADWPWIRSAFLGIGSYFFGTIAGRFASLLLLAGAYLLCRRKEAVCTLLVLPLLAALAASATRGYPFEGRLLLFAFPLLVLLMAFGAERCWPHKLRCVAPITIGIVLVALAWRAESQSAGTHEELRPAIAYLAQHVRPGDQIYVFYASIDGFRFYTTIAPVRHADKIVSAGPVLGNPLWIDGRRVADLRDLRSFSHGRLWIVASHFLGSSGVNQDTRLQRALEAEHWKQIDFALPAGASVRLYQSSRREADAG